MFLQFSAENHLSFKEEVRVSLVATSLKDFADGLLPSEAAGPNRAALPASLIYGANAAGKSNLIAAVNCMCSIIIHSHISAGPDDKLLYRPFAFDKACVRKPTYFETDFVIGGVRYNYSFSYDANSIHTEALYSFPTGRAQMLFSRGGGEFKFGRKLRGPNKIIAELTRPNSLFLSSATQNDHDELTPIYRFFSDIVFSTSFSVSGAETPSRADDVDDRAIRFLEAIGTGVVGFRLESEMVPEASQEFVGDLRKLIDKHFPDIANEDFASEHRKLQLAHQGFDGGSVFLDFARESAGTRRLLFLLSSIFKVLDNGGVIFVDELDASLHTQAFELVLALFSRKKYNRNGAQIIATVHDTNILDCDFMRRDQFWFAEKSKAGDTTFFALSDIRLRSSDNFERGYLQGRFGALPYGDDIDSVLGNIMIDD